MANWKKYKDAVTLMSNDMKETNTYKRVAEMLLRDVKEGGDSLIIKEKLPVGFVNEMSLADQ